MKTLKIIQKGQKILGGIFDVDSKQAKLEKIIEQLSDPAIWDDPKQAQELNKEKVHIEKELTKFNVLESAIQDSIELTEKGLELMTSSTENKDFFILPDVGGNIAEIDK